MVSATCHKVTGLQGKPHFRSLRGSFVLLCCAAQSMNLDWLCKAMTYLLFLYFFFNSIFLPIRPRPSSSLQARTGC